MIARGLRAVRRMAMGATSSVYVLAKATGDSLDRLGSTDSAHQTQDEATGNLTLRIAEDAVLDETAMIRAAAFALASESDGSFTIYRRIEDASPPLGDADRTWSFTVAPTGVVFVPASYFLLESGADQIAMETSGLVLLEAQ